MHPLDNTELMLARGRYATIRAEHEDAKREFSVLCGRLSAASCQALKRMQPANDATPESIDALLEDCRKTIETMQACAYEITRLAKERAELKITAWKK